MLHCREVGKLDKVTVCSRGVILNRVGKLEDKRLCHIMSGSIGSCTSGAGLKNFSYFTSMAGKTRPYSIKNYALPLLADIISIVFFIFVTDAIIIDG